MKTKLVFAVLAVSTVCIARSQDGTKVTLSLTKGLLDGSTSSPPTSSPPTSSPSTSSPSTNSPVAGSPSTGSPVAGSPVAGSPSTGSPADGRPGACGDPVGSEPVGSEPVELPFWMAREIALDLSEKEYLEALGEIQQKEIAILRSLVQGLEQKDHSRILQLKLLQKQLEHLEISLPAARKKKPRDHLAEWVLGLIAVMGVGYLLGS